MNYEDVKRLSAERGFFFPSAEIYSDSPAGFWEYGPLGVLLKNNVLEVWRKEILRSDGMVEIDGSVILPKNVFDASGHTDSFYDTVIQCKSCGIFLRADKFLSEKTGKIIPERIEPKEIVRLIEENHLRCPRCKGEFKEPKRFNMMFKVGVGPEQKEMFLRPETAQSIFVDFSRVFRAMRLKLPVGIAQVGKSFRNEIAPRQGLIRLRELYQAEVEVFFNPALANPFERLERVGNTTLRLLRLNGEYLQGSAKSLVAKGAIPTELIAYYLALLQRFYNALGMKLEKTRFREMSDIDKAFYTKVGYDFEVDTSLGWLELVACNYRTDYDLSRHSEKSTVDLSVVDDSSKLIPHVFELSMGVDRTLYAVLENSLTQEKERENLRLVPRVAPYQAGVFPLLSKDGLPEIAREVYLQLSDGLTCWYDESGSIGRRYRRMDEVGTPFCVTIDHKTKEDGTVTIRERDSMKQERVNKVDLYSIISKLVKENNIKVVIKAS